MAVRKLLNIFCLPCKLVWISAHIRDAALLSKLETSFIPINKNLNKRFIEQMIVQFFKGLLTLSPFPVALSLEVSFHIPIFLILRTVFELATHELFIV